MNKTEKAAMLWYDRKRTFLGLPLSFTKYAFSDDRFFIEKGFFTTTYDEVRLYRILDVKLTQTLGQKLFNVGTIKVFSSDKAQGEFEILSVKNPKSVKEHLSQRIEIEREAKRVYNRETLGDDHCDCDNQDGIEDNL